MEIGKPQVAQPKGKAKAMNNYASTTMNDHRHSERAGGSHALSHRPGPASASTSRMPGGRFAPPVQNPQHAEPYDQISDEHRSEINDCVGSPFYIFPFCFVFFQDLRDLERRKERKKETDGRLTIAPIFTVPTI